MIRAVALLAMLLAVPAAAQTFGLSDEEPLPPLTVEPEIRPRFDDTPRESRTEAEVASAPGALLRGLDKISGETVDFDLDVGTTARMGRIEIELGDCRYPVGNPSGDAFAFVEVRADGLDAPAFRGWMIASSPALSALDHPRYDVWVMRCRSS